VSAIEQTAGRPFARTARALSPDAGPPPGRADALTRAFAGGIAWTAAARWSAQAISWGATLVVARFLSPADYGLVAMATVFIGLVAIVNEFGVGMTVVTLRDLSDEQIAQLHGLALAVGVINGTLSIALARLVAAFFGRPELVAIVSLLGVTFVAAGLRTVPTAMLQRSFRYRALAAIESAQAVVAALVALGAALAGAGYWALVGSQLVAAVVWTAAASATAPARLAWPSRRVLGGAFDFTRHQLTGSIAWYCYSSSDFVVAGRVLGAVELGTYSLAWTFARIVPERLANVVIGVAPSFLAAVRDDLPVLRQWIYALTEALALVTFPMLVGIALTAPDLVHLAVGDRWQSAVMPLRLLALYGAFDSVLQLVTRGLVAAGDVRFTARLGLLLAVVMPLAFLAGARWGATGIAVAWLVVAPPCRLALLQRARRRIGLEAREYWRALWPAVSATAIMAVAVLAVRAAPAFDAIVARAAAEVAAGAAAYGLAVWYGHPASIRRWVARLQTIRRGDDR
jgi:PST family polysaccharide transporter